MWKHIVLQDTNSKCTFVKINMCHENNFNIQRKDQRSSIQKEFEYLACDEELKSEHVGGKKKIKHMIANKNLYI